MPGKTSSYSISARCLSELTYLLTYVRTYLLAYLLTYLLTYLFTCLLTYLLTYSLTHSLTYILTYLLTYSLTYACQRTTPMRTTCQPTPTAPPTTAVDGGSHCRVRVATARCGAHRAMSIRLPGPLFLYSAVYRMYIQVFEKNGSRVHATQGSEVPPSGYKHGTGYTFCHTVTPLRRSIGHNFRL